MIESGSRKAAKINNSTLSLTIHSSSLKRIFKVNIKGAACLMVNSYEKQETSKSS
jgi:hypothetical protein